MKKETQIILTADEGKYITDGKDYCTEVRLPESVNPDEWYEITEEEYEEIKAREDVPDV